MPQHFLQEAGVNIKDLKGGIAGFSGSHDATLALIQSGSYEAGALNEQIWEKNVNRGRVNNKKVRVFKSTWEQIDLWVVGFIKFIMTR